MKRRSTSLLTVAAFGYAFLYLPVLLLTFFSFNQSSAGNLPFTGFTFKWYADLFRDYLVIDAFKNSLWVAFVTSLLATVIGTAAAFPLVRAAIRFKDYLRIAFLLPMMVPASSSVSPRPPRRCGSVR